MLKFLYKYLQQKLSQINRVDLTFIASTPFYWYLLWREKRTLVEVVRLSIGIHYNQTFFCHKTTHILLQLLLQILLLLSSKFGELVHLICLNYSTSSQVVCHISLYLQRCLIIIITTTFLDLGNDKTQSDVSLNNWRPTWGRRSNQPTPGRLAQVSSKNFCLKSLY